MERERQYNWVVAGGTFDRLHPGHKALLKKAFETGEHVEIDLMTDDYITKSHKAGCGVESCGKRLRVLSNYLKEQDYINRAYFYLIDDPLDTDVHKDAPDRHYDAIVVSEESIRGALDINKIREEKGLKDLDIVKVVWQKDSSGKVISSTRIRKQEINSEGEIIG